MALAAGAQLAEVHRLTGVEVEDVADAIAEAQGVGRGLRKAFGLKAIELRPRRLEAAAVEIAGPGIVHLLGHARAQVGRQALPLAGQHPVALEVAKATVVRDDLEPVANRLPPAARS